MGSGVQNGEVYGETFDEAFVIDDADPSEINLYGRLTDFDADFYGSSPTITDPATTTPIRIRVANVTISRIVSICDGAGTAIVPESSGNNALIESCLMDASFAAVSVSVSGRVDVKNCMYMNTSRGVTSGNTTNLMDIYNNTAYSCADGGIYMSTGASGKLVINQIAVGGTAQDYRGQFDGSSDTNIDSDGTAPGTTTYTSSAANLFVSTVGGSEDLHLKSGADAIDVGTNSGAPSTDIDGDAIQNGTKDIGADEFVTEAAGATPTTKPKFILPTNWGQIEKIEPRGLITSEMYASN